MPGLVYSCVTPHGFSVIGEVAGTDYELLTPTREAMEELGRRVSAANPDTVVVLTPHGLRLGGHIAVYTSAHCRGTMSGGGNTISLDMDCDLDLAKQILEGLVAADLPAVGCNYGALSGAMSSIPMDWGAFVPLWFLGGRWEKKPKIVVIGPTREIPVGSMVTMGEIIAKLAQSSGKSVVLVASADQGHAHDKNGPYGYDPAAKEYDEMVNDIVKQDRLADLLHMDLGFVDRAKPDSLWQMLALYGATRVVQMKGEFLSYQLPSYYGMMVAAYEPVAR